MIAAVAVRTLARRTALRVLRHGEAADQPVYESNHTSDLADARSAVRLAVYWQTVRWLESHGLLTSHRAPGGLVLRLTDAGRHIAAELPAQEPA